MRIDVAHFIKIYVNVLSKEHRLIKIFYFGVLGKIIVARDLETVSKIIEAVLIVSQSETCGQTCNKETNPAPYAKPSCKI